MKWGIRKTALAISVGPAALIAVLLTALFTIMGVRSLDDALAQQGHSLARRLAASAEFGVVSGNTAELEKLLRENLNEPDVGGLLITNASLKPFATAGSLKPSDYGDLTQAIDTGTRNYAQGYVLFKQPILLSQDAGQDDLFSQKRPDVAQKRIVLGYAMVALSYHSTQVKAGLLIITALAILIVGLILTAILSIWISKRIALPIVRLAKAASATSRGNLQVRVPADSYGELLLLENSFNQMAEAIEQSRQELESRIAEATSQYLKQKESAETANLAKSRFLAAASHDLRQPLHAIGLFMGALSSRIQYPEVRDLVDKTNESVATLENLLNALLDISRLDAAVITPQFATFPIEVVLRQIEREFTPVAAAKQLRLHVRPCRCVVYSDPMLLKRIAGNLVANAIRYTQQGGVVIGCRQRGDTLRLEVWDTGPGIAEEHHAHIFEEFYQIGNAERDRNKGLGLGLAIVARMAKLLGIETGFHSRLKHGSCFYVRLPMAGGQIQSSAIPAPMANGILAGKLVVVIDDERSVQEGMVALIESMGSVAVAAATPGAAIRQLHEKKRPPDLLISDYRLADNQNGIKAIHALRSEFGTGLPAILVSGDTSPNTLKEAESAQLKLLHKPVSAAKLTQAMIDLAR